MFLKDIKATVNNNQTSFKGDAITGYTSSYEYDLNIKTVLNTEGYDNLHLVVEATGNTPVAFKVTGKDEAVLKEFQIEPRQSNRKDIDVDIQGNPVVRVWVKSVKGTYTAFTVSSQSYISKR
jgi:LEA14-like dessication related protein